MKHVTLTVGGDDRLWLDEHTVQISTLNNYTSCTGYIEVGECGNEQACMVGENTDYARFTVEITVEPCAQGWCPSRVEIVVRQVTAGTCYSPTMAESNLEEAVADELASSIEELSWSCP